MVSELRLLVVVSSAEELSSEELGSTPLYLPLAELRAPVSDELGIVFSVWLGEAGRFFDPEVLGRFFGSSALCAKV